MAALALIGPLQPAPAPEACEPAAESLATGGHTLAVECRSGSPLRGPARLLFGQRLDPNRADARSLEVLPGIGPARAAAIVRERCRRPFASAGELERVGGIGPVTLARLAPHLAVSAPAKASCGG